MTAGHSLLRKVQNMNGAIKSVKETSQRPNSPYNL